MHVSKLVPVINIALFSCVAYANAQGKEKPNILFIIADDLRPELGCYGVEDIKTPNIDRFAQGATVFNNAYCNIPISGASRASLLTGVYPLYPDRFTAFDAYAEKDYPQAVTLPRHFRENGYYAVSNGKIFHNITDNADSWSEYPWRLNPDGYGKDWAEYNKWELWLNSESGNHINPRTKRGPFCESADVPDTAYDDGMVAQRTIADLRRLKDKDQPFFIACGFWRPHLPFNAPKKYWDMYKRDEIKLAENPYRSENLPKQVTGSTEIMGYSRIADTKDEDFQREAKHGYYACVSFIDAQIGLILDELERLNLSDNTIVVILGDHGWHLGEHGFWGKHNLMNHATRSPLIIKAPQYKGGKADGVVEFVDLYPTLCDLTGVKAPKKQLQGKSIKPVLQNQEKRIKEHAYVQWRGGYNIVTEEYSYACWLKDGKQVAEMLFDRSTDKAENTNIVDKDSYGKAAKNLNKTAVKKKESVK